MSVVTVSAEYMPGGIEFTGYRIDLEDQREIQDTATPFTVAYGDYNAPEEVDPRKLMRHDKQGAMGSCQGFSLANCGELLWMYNIGLAQYSNDHQFSSLFSYLETQRVDGLLGRDVGSTISGGLKIGRDVGFLEEKHLRYRTPYPRDARSMITSEMRLLAAPFKIRSHSWLRTYTDIFNYLASGAGAVHTGTIWNNSFYARNGVLESVSSSGGGGHATAWLGYTKRKDRRGRNYLLRLNSHNDSWTEIAPSVIDQLCAHRHTSIVGVSDLSTPGPRKINWSQAHGII